MPNIYDLIDRQRAQLLQRDDAYLASLVDGWRDVEAALQSRIEALAQYMATLAAQEQTITESVLYREQRYVALLAQTRSVIMDYAGEVATSLTEQQQAFATAGTNDARAVLQEARVTPSFNVLARGATNVAIGLAGDGSPLRTLLSATWPDAVEAMTRTLIRNTALGVNPRKTAREMREATGGSLVRMLAIARTESLRAYRESSRSTYREAGVRKFKRVAAHNKRTCYLCLSQDGKEQDANQPLAIHTNCRCTIAPSDIPGYTLPTHQTGEEWLRQQSAATQKEVLGKGRYEMWKDGTALDAFGVIVNDPTWGPTLKPRTVVDVKDNPHSIISLPQPTIAPTPQPKTPAAPIPVKQFKTPTEADTYLRRIATVRADNLTELEEDGLLFYQGASYEVLNNYLRGTPLWEHDDEEKRIFQTKIDGLSSTMQRSETVDNLETYRGLTFRASENPKAKALLDSWQPGATFRDPSYISSTFAKDVADSFAGGHAADDDEFSVHINLRVPAGTRALYLNAALPDGNTTEWELLIDKGYRYRIIEQRTEVKQLRRSSETRTIVEMEIIPDDED